MSAKKSSSLLVSYAGYPYTITSFMTDNGLANLAALLVQEGHHTKILDYSTVSSVRRHIPESVQKQLERIWDDVVARAEEGKDAGVWANAQLLMIQKYLERVQFAEVDRIAQEVLTAIEKDHVDFVGFKLWSGDGLSGTLRIAKAVRRKFPHVKLFAGGAPVDIFREHTYKAEPIMDAIVFGEGEETILPLAEAALGQRSLESVPNLILKKNGNFYFTEPKRVDCLDSLPRPLYDEDVYLSMRGDEKLKMITIDDSRGCHFKCAFCHHPLKSGNSERTKDPKKFVEEIKDVVRRTGVTTFQFAGSNPPYEFLEQLSDELMAQKVAVEWSTMCSTPQAEFRVYDKMRRAGCYALLFGIESGSNAVLAKMRKPQNKHIIAKAVAQAKEAGIFVTASFIYPAPFDTPETREESIQFINEIKLDSVTGIWGEAAPGSEWGENPEKFNIEPSHKDREKWIEDILMYKSSATAAPPAFTPPYPHKINGMSFKEYCMEHDQFFRRLEKMGFVTALGSSEALLAKRMGKDPRSAKDAWIRALYVGDQDTLTDLITTHNHYDSSDTLLKAA